MSGPKLSQAELERMRLEQLERERQAALKRLQEAQSAYRGECDRITSLRASTSSILSQVDAVYRADIETKMNVIISNIHTIQVADTKSPESYYAAKNAIAKNIEAASKELDSILNIVLNRIANDKKLSDTNTAYQSFQSIVGAIGKELSVVRINFQNSYDEDIVNKQLNSMLKHFLSLSHRTDALDISEFSKKAVFKIQAMLSDGKNRKKLEEIRAVMQRMINEEQELIRLWQEKRSLYDEYVALALMTDRTPKDPEDFNSSDVIRAEISRLRHLYKKQDEMDYIADQINDAMVDLGYTFVTSKVLTKKDQGETDFSLYKADEQTGIAVYTDQTGAVMMRMTVLGDDPAITDADRDFSYQKQIDFCAGHPDLVAALAERGVFLKQKSYQEPDRAHTYKIAMKGQSQSMVVDIGTTKKNTNDQKLDRRRRRRAGNKKMRAM